MFDQLHVVDTEDTNRAVSHSRQKGLVDRQPELRAPPGHRTPQEPAQHIPGTLIPWQRTLGNRKDERAHMVCDDAGITHRLLG